MEYEMTSNVNRGIFRQQQPYDSNNNNGTFTQSQNHPAINQSAGFPKKKKITDFFQVSRVAQKPQQKVDKRDFLFIAAEHITAEDLMKSGGRATVTVNDTEIALVAHNSMVYAIEPKCPHVGGPLHLGDIEDIPGCGPSIKCPWHSWTFSLSSGRCIAPQNRCPAQNIRTFPVHMNPSGSEIKIGFTEISPKTFNSLPE